MPSTSPPRAREALDLGHHRREARDRADPQVVPVGEPAGDDHGVDAAQVRVAVPEQLGVADAAGRQQRVDLVTRARETERSRTSRLDLVVLDQRVGEQLLAHRRAPARRPRRRARPAGRRARWRRPRSRAPAAPARRPGPAGSRIPALGRIRTRTLTTRRGPATRRTARPRAARRRSRSARASARPRRPGSAARAGSCPSRCSVAQSRTYCLSNDGWPWPTS